MTETIQEIYEKAHNEEYDNILIKDMQMRIEDKINSMARKYLEEIGLKYDEDLEKYEGEILVSEYDKDDNVVDIKYKFKLILAPIDVRIKSDKPEFSFD